MPSYFRDSFSAGTANKRTGLGASSTQGTVMNLKNLLPPQSILGSDLAVPKTIFKHFTRRLAAHRNEAIRFANAECASNISATSIERMDSFSREINEWAQGLLQKAWVICHQNEAQEEDSCPVLDSLADTSIGELPPLPSADTTNKFLNTILFLHITTCKSYSAHSRVFLSSLGSLDEATIIQALKNPDKAIEQIKQQTQETTANHALKGRTGRMIGMGLGAIAGGVLIGVTGGLAAPLIGAGVTTILGWVGLGGTAAGLFASGLAGSSIICGALFGAYGAQSVSGMVERHTREIRDLAVVPVGDHGENDTLAVRLCVSGWLEDNRDVVRPWEVLKDGGDTFALQWEVMALKELSTALSALVKSAAMKYIRFEVIKHTAFSALMMSLAPVALLNVGQIIDNPWMNCRARALKTGAVLGELLSKRVFGNRPVTLAGYSLGSLVIFEALKHLSTLPVSQTMHLVEDVFFFGSPIPVDESTWTAIRRLVAGRMVNGFCEGDYVLGTLCRATMGNWNVAGLQVVEVAGVENLLCKEIEGHAQWREGVGECILRISKRSDREEYPQSTFGPE